MAARQEVTMCRKIQSKIKMREARIKELLSAIELETIEWKVERLKQDLAGVEANLENFKKLYNNFQCQYIIEE